MAKPTPYWVTLNQAPRSAKQNGKHRRAGAPAHGSPVVGTDHGAGDQSVQIISWNTRWTISEPEPAPPTIPYAGIRAGELIGYRYWWLLGDGSLYSLAHKRKWEPGETVAGKIEDAVDQGLFYRIYGGVYAYGSPGIASADNHRPIPFPIPTDAVWDRPLINWFSFDAANDEPVETSTVEIIVGRVFGSVKMWGEVIEHEKGWRAEFAKIHSLDALDGQGDLNELRARYGVTSPSLSQNQG